MTVAGKCEQNKVERRSQKEGSKRREMKMGSILTMELQVVHSF